MDLSVWTSGPNIQDKIIEMMVCNSMVYSNILMESFKNNKF